MKKGMILVILLLLLPTAIAVENYNNYTEVELLVNFNSGAEVTAGSFSYFSAELFFYPKNTGGQSIDSFFIESNPEAEITESEDSITYDWETSTSSLEYGYQALITSENELVKIYNKIPYPNLADDSVSKYTLPTEFIDITPEMEDLADEIIGSEDDMYKVVWLLAEWTRQNIEYNLTSLTAEAVQSSSWVLENREGVCDELTNLFISFARSRGIPARFESGLVYTNTLNDFGPHGWAEVYIDDTWVPVDVTFGSMGWYDPDHIAFNEEADSGSSAVMYQWSGNAKIDTKEPEITAKVLSLGDAIDYDYGFEIEALVTEVGPGSFVPLQVKLTNPYNYYLPLKLHITKAPGLNEENTKLVLLEPYEEASVFWIAEISDEAEEGLIYKTQVEIQTMLGKTVSTEIKYGKHYQAHTLEEAEEIVNNLIIPEESSYLEGVSLDCKLNKEVYYENETAVLQCTIHGASSDITVCFREDCLPSDEDLGWELDLTEYQSQKLAIFATNGESTLADYVDLYVISYPLVEISNVDPNTLNWNKESELVIEMNSNSKVYNAIIIIEGYGKLTIDEFSGSYIFTIPVSAKNFPYGTMDFSLSYQDELGENYTTNHSEKIQIEDMPFYFKIIYAILSLF